MEQVKKFLETLRTDPKAKELLGTTEPENKEEALNLYAKAAEALGFSLTAKELEDGFNKIAEELQDKTAAVKSTIKALDLEDLGQVAGGDSSDVCAPAADGATKVKEHSNCEETYRSDENCWGQDRCSSVIVNYKNEEHCKMLANCDRVMM